MAASDSASQYFLWGWERFFEELSSFLQAAERQESTANVAFSEYVVERLQISIMNVSMILHHWQSITPDEDHHAETGAYLYSQLAGLLQCLREIAQEWQMHIDQYEARNAATSYAATAVQGARPGRPRFNITREQLEYLASMSFSWTQIARMLGVSQMTIYRRRLEYGLLEVGTGNMSNDELQTVLLQMRRDLPALGETMVWGRLRSMGFHVTRARVRSAIRTTDPIHTALRWRGDLTRRRPYSVPGPNSLWHLGL